MIINNRPTSNLITDLGQCSFGQFLSGEQARKLTQDNAEMARLIKEIIPFHTALHHSAKDILQNWRPNHPGLNDTLRARLDDHRVWGEQVAEAIIARQQNLRVETDPAKCALGVFLRGPLAGRYAQDFPAFADFISAIAAPHERLHGTAVSIKDTLSKSNFEKAGKIYTEQTLPALNQCEALITRVIAAETAITQSQEKALHIFEHETMPALNETAARLKAMQDQARKMVAGLQQATQIFSSETKSALNQTRKLMHQITETVGRNVMTDEMMLSAAQRTRLAVIILSLIAAVIGLGLAYFISNGIARGLTRVINALSEGAHQVAAAAGQVSSASQSLAEGSSQQAASLEETSSSVEKMASMTRQNADNSDQADRLTKETIAAVRSAAESITSLRNATEEIYSASQETQRIVKSIDEIAFQTNLLALNTAVEAARAGEAGAGFAVVADEVRNLAARSAEAAKSTAELIGATVNKVSVRAGKLPPIP